VPMVDKSTSGMSEILYEVRVLEVAYILLVTLSGAGAPLVRLYLMPKSSVGPVQIISSALNTMDSRKKSTYHQGCD
jgi:hypothetical protein